MQYSVQLLERAVAAPVQVHLYPLDERVEGRARQAVGGDERLQRTPLRGRRRRAIETPRHLVAPALDFHRTLLRRRLVHGVVDRTAEVPDGDDRAPLVGRQYQERVVEARVSRQSGPVPRGYCAAGRASLAQDSVPQRIDGASAFVSAGRCV